MADSEKEAVKVISRIGKQLGAFKTCPNKDTLVNLLKVIPHSQLSNY